MPSTSWDEDDSWIDDGDWPDESDAASDLMECPYCGTEILADTPRCPACEHYLSNEDRPPEQRPPWLWIVVVICIVLVLAWLAEG
jgi:uncharacterized protein (DUF983 family)